MTDRDVLIDAFDDLVEHLGWPDDSIDVTERAVEELRAAPVSVSATASTGRRRRLRQLAARRRWLAVAAAIVVLVLAVAAVPSAREAVADLLGLGGIRITGSDDAGPQGEADGRLDLGRRVSPGEAERLSPAPLPRPAGVGRPNGVYAGEPRGGVTLVWAPDENLPEVLDHDVGMIITVFPGDLGRSEAVIEKRTREGGTVELIEVEGARAYWLSGEPHEYLYVDENGITREDTIRLSGNALIWQDNGFTYRLESALPRSEVVRLAETLH